MYWATNKPKNCPITLVILGNRDLFKFFEATNKKVFNNSLNLIYSEPHQLRRAKAGMINAIIHLVPDMIKEKQCLGKIFHQHFAELKGHEVFFFSQGFDGGMFYLLKRLSKKNSLAYMPYYRSPQYMMGEYTPKNLIDLARLVAYKLLYGRGITTGKFPRQNPHATGFPYISDRFIEKEVERVFGEEERKKLMEDFDLSRFKVFDASNYSVIYFDDGLLGSGFKDGDINKETFQKELDRIFQILIKYFPKEKIAHKYHPGYADRIIITTGDILPAFIPAEFLYNDNTKIYLSLFSLSLANVERGLAVSLANLVSLNDQFRNKLKKFLIKMSKSKILFPKSLDEFEQILIGLKNQKY